MSVAGGGIMAADDGDGASAGGDVAGGTFATADTATDTDAPTDGEGVAPTGASEVLPPETGCAAAAGVNGAGSSGSNALATAAAVTLDARPVRDALRTGAGVASLATLLA